MSIKSDKTKETILGIDLGTTNSLVAVQDEKGLRILSDGENPLIPSIVAYDDSGKVLAVGGRAKTLKSIDPKRVVYSVKRLMGKGKADFAEAAADLPFDFSPSTPDSIRIRIGDQVKSPVEISAEILKRCKFVGENALGRALKKAVITVPAYFNDAERSATSAAGRIAGLDVIRIINEPTAAALAYGLGEVSGQKTIAVYDFGGGTFDISILKVTSGIFEVLATSGNIRLGGDDLDRALFEYLVREKIHAEPTAEEDKILLLSQIEVLKKTLSFHSMVEAKFYWGDEVRYSGYITREEVERVWKPIVDQTFISCQSALDGAHLKAGDIEEVVMVGGSTRMPIVRLLVKSFFGGREPNTSVNPEEVVALGAAIQGAILSGELKDALLLDVVPLSLGLETMGGLVSKIILRNSTIPCAASESFTTYADNQTAFDLHILQGEREKVGDCRSLGRFKLKVAPAAAGFPKLKVNFVMDANGILKVSAVNERTGESADFEAKPSFGLSDAEVEKMLRDAFENSQRDFADRQLIEVKTQAQALVRATEKSLKNPLLGSEFLDQQKVKLNPIVQALKADLESNKVEVIALRVRELDQAARALAEEILNSTVQASLLGQSMAT